MRALYIHALEERSDLLLIVGQSEKALEDIETALSNKISIHQKYSLLLKKAHILLKGKSDPVYAEKIIDPIYQKLKNKKYTNIFSKTMGIKASIYNFKGDYEKGLNFYEQVLKYAKENKNFLLQSDTLNNMSTIYYHLEKYKDAIKLGNMALKIYLKINNKMRIAAIYSNLGLFYTCEHLIDKAEVYIQKYLKLSEKMGYIFGIANATNQLGQIFKQKNKFKKALSYFNKYLDISEKIHNKRGIAIANGNIGIAYDSLKEYNKALIHYKIYVNISKEIKYKKGIGNGLIHIAEIEIIRNNFEKAVEDLNQAEEIFENMKNQSQLSKIYTNLYLIYEKLNKPNLLAEIQKKMKDMNND